MTCYFPLKGWRSRQKTANGKRKIVFNKNEGFADLPVEVPCGQCIGCRLERSRQWAIRCVHESSLYEDNCFITLTYNDENLPADGGLVLSDFQKFMKRLRKRFGDGIRFFHCGEYGENFGRPHYHACLFNFDLPDRELWSIRNGVRLYTSEILNEVWGKGFCSVGDVTFESAAYVARYITKKVTGEAADDHYQSLNLDTGEIVWLRPEYTTMSRRPGIGKGWYEIYGEATHHDDYIIMNGKKMKPPKYYDGLFELNEEDLCRSLKIQRKKAAEQHADNNTPDRLKVRHTIQERRLDKLPRKLK